jgi:MerR family transcriptional regulator, copper efflux regulator
VPGTDAAEAAPAAGQLQIGAVAERTGLSIRTLRHYDEVGLVTPSARTPGGFRLYTADDVARLTTIRRMKPLGFTLDEMRTLLASLDVLDDPTTDATARREAETFVVDCHARAEESCQTLRRQLGYAEEFRDLLALRDPRG